MRSNLGKATAVIALILTSTLFGVLPVNADELIDDQSALTTEPIAAPALDAVPIDETVPAETEPEPVLAEPAAETPAVEELAPEGVITPEIVEPTEATPVEDAPGAAPVETPATTELPAVEPTVTALAGPRPAPGETGYTHCWVTHPELPNLDPYDVRTWPGNATCFPDQSITKIVQTVVTSTNTTTGQTIVSTYDTVASNTTSTVVSGDEASNPHSPAEANLVVRPGDALRISYAVGMTFPAADTKPVIGDDGVAYPRVPTRLEMRSSSPLVSTWQPGVITDSSCDSVDFDDVTGSTVYYTCSVEVMIPSDLTFADWQRDSGSLLGIQLIHNPQLRAVDANNGAAGPWGPAPTTGGVTNARVDPAQTWLPTAQDQTFRVKTFETLTVTPSGLLTGASWSQGDVSGLDVYVNDIPAGGTLTGDGNLEFTSKEVGEFGFQFYLQDPVTELRSRNAVGEIEVYEEAVIAPTEPEADQPQLVIEPPRPATPVEELAHTGAGQTYGVLLLAGLLPVTGILLLLIRRKQPTPAPARR